jgi:hypothetical protein
MNDAHLVDMNFIDRRQAELPIFFGLGGVVEIPSRFSEQQTADDGQLRAIVCRAKQIRRERREP